MVLSPGFVLPGQDRGKVRLWIPARSCSTVLPSSLPGLFPRAPSGQGCCVRDLARAPFRHPFGIRRAGTGQRAGPKSKGARSGRSVRMGVTHPAGGPSPVRLTLTACTLPRQARSWKGVPHAKPARPQGSPRVPPYPLPRSSGGPAAAHPRVPRSRAVPARSWACLASYIMQYA